MNIQAVFIDRDGTIGGSDKVNFPSEFTMFPNVVKSLLELKNKNILTFAFTNQPAISRNEVREEDFHNELRGIGFDDIYLCPHAPGDGCLCRKPSPGMLLKAASKHNLDLTKCVVIGDRWTDMLAAHKVNAIKILVKTGAGESDYNIYINDEFFGEWAEIKLDYVANDFEDATDWLLNNYSEE